MKKTLQIVILCIIYINTYAQEEKKEYYESGEVKSISVLNEKSLVNEAEYFYKSGNLQAKGKWQGYYTLTGTPRWEKTGVWEFYYENGVIAKSGRYRDDKNHDEWKYYTDEGILVRKEKYDLDGELSGITEEYYENGQVARSIEFSSNVPDGEDKSHYENGQVARVANYADGKMDGKETVYYENGELFKIVLWDHSKLMNVLSYNDMNGNALNVGDFKDGNGTLNNFDGEGKLLGTIKVVDGVIQQ